MIREALLRGWRRRCPRCGEGELFRRRLQAHECCSSCGLQFQPDQGDTLMFMVITDRIPILVGVIAVYFLGFRSNSVPITIGFLVAMTLPLLATLRNRQGVAMAMVYLSRLYFGDLSEAG